MNNYWNKQLIDLLTFGFPLDFDRLSPLHSTLENHDSAHQVQEYLDTEISHVAILGPFKEPPFKMHMSPLMTHSKQNSTKRRTILDLSWLKCASVNGGVSSDVYLDTYFKLRYPSIDDITYKLIFKVDISRAFRHIRIDPGDIDLLGIRHSNAYINTFLAFSFKHGSTSFQPCSDAIRHIMRQNGVPHLWNYIDNWFALSDISCVPIFIGFVTPASSRHKSGKISSTHDSSYLFGYSDDTKTRTISIPPDQLLEITQLCDSWIPKCYCTTTQLQSLLGSLLYICKCVRPARYFLNRMLTLLRENRDNKI